MTIMSFDASARNSCSEIDSDNELDAVRAQLEECEQRVAAMMWVLGVIRRGVEWQEESPMLRLIDRTLSHEEARGSSLGPNVARMTIRRAAPSPVQYADLDSA
ncbi:MAG: hypothetical protein K2Y29_16290 [Beijerinckiaceae bacterium]|nr:hypothetical protein [Beijerinckiaceae bacterium]